MERFSLHSYCRFHADELAFGNTNLAIFVVNIKTKENMKLPLKGEIWGTQIALDPVKERIYWGDYMKHTIWSAKWDGTNQKVVLKLPGRKCTFTFVSSILFLDGAIFVVFAVHVVRT